MMKTQLYPKWLKISQLFCRNGPWNHHQCWSPVSPNKQRQSWKKVYEASDVGVKEDEFLALDDRVTTNEATSFFPKLQQTKKGLHYPEYKRILVKTDFPPDLVANSDAKIIIQPTRSKTIVKRKIQTLNKASEKQRLDDEQFAEDSQAEEISTPARETLRFWEMKTLELI